jgi:murein DD-endopeptidase MepM/ murein hydrolase activator NlpD
VVLDHGLGVFSMLAHLSRIDVKPGTIVVGGDVVGAIGATGRVTGPHLHWTLRIGAAAVDPLSILAIAGAGR